MLGSAEVQSMEKAGPRALSVPQARQIVQGLFEPNPYIYWADFLVSVTIGYTAASIYLFAPLFSSLQLACLAVAAVALYRVSLFMHEIVHMSGRQMRWFRVAWNLLAGIPMLMPSFFYDCHLEHHSSRHYGTGNDGEYLPFGLGPWRNIGYFLLEALFLPLMVLFRFLVLTPVSFLHPRLRKWVLERASSFTINLRYRRIVPQNIHWGVWIAMEWACFLRAAGMVGVWAVGIAPFSRLPLLYLLAVVTLGLNHIRSLSAHRYLSKGLPISHTDQLDDSVNITGDPILTELLCPVGLRFHALHHLFPTLPYHNLGIAHQRLMEQLPADSPYRDTVYPTFWSVISELLQRSREASQQPTNGADQWYRHREEQLAERAALCETRAAREPARS